MSLYAWGTSKHGELGHGDFEDTVDPSVLEHLKGKVLVQVACGECHSVGITEHGSVYTWGRGREGQLGNGTTTHKQTKPVRVEALRRERITTVSAGYYHNLAVSDRGRVFQWGKLYKHMDGPAEGYFGMNINLPGLDKQRIDSSHRRYYAGELSEAAIEGQTTDFAAFRAYLSSVPEPVEELADKTVVAVAGGYSFSLAVTAEGELYAWGFNDKFQCGVGHRFNVPKPCRVEFPAGVRIKAVAAGQQHALALTTEGRVFGWGLGVFGQLGNGHASDRNRPGPVLLDARIVQIACGSHHSLALSDDGKVYTWGSSEYGQQGGMEGNYNDWASGERGKAEHSSLPRVLQVCAKPLRQIACGHLFNLALTVDGELYTWGWGSSGALGHGNRRVQLVPQLVARMRGEPLAWIAAGGKHSLAINRGSVTTFAFDFKPFVNSAQYSDLTFRLEGKTFAAHRAIVFARCPLLRAHAAIQRKMLGHADIELRGIKPQVLLAVLYYLYTDHLKCPPHLLGELAAVARRHKLPRLAQLAQRVVLASEPIMPSSFKTDMLAMVAEPEFSDLLCKLEDGRALPTHRVVLAARCEYFATIFACGFQEAGKPTLTIPGVDTPSFTSLLRFLYGGDDSIVQSEHVVDVLIGADRFLLDDLKQMCESQLEDALDAENVAMLLEVADRFNAPRLKRVCLETIVRDWKTFQTSKGLGALAQTALPLLREIDQWCLQRKLTENPGEVIRVANKLNAQPVGVVAH